MFSCGVCACAFCESPDTPLKQDPADKDTQESVLAVKKTDTAAPAVPADKAGKIDLFSVSTDDLDKSESLDRISGGHFDRGRSSPDQSYKSNKGGTPGPFAREKQATGDSSSGY